MYVKVFDSPPFDLGYLLSLFASASRNAVFASATTSGQPLHLRNRVRLFPPPFRSGMFPKRRPISLQLHPASRTKPLALGFRVRLEQVRHRLTRKAGRSKRASLTPGR